MASPRLLNYTNRFQFFTRSVSLSLSLFLKHAALSNLLPPPLDKRTNLASCCLHLGTTNLSKRNYFPWNTHGVPELHLHKGPSSTSLMIYFSIRSIDSTYSIKPKHVRIFEAILFVTALCHASQNLVSIWSSPNPDRLWNVKIVTFSSWNDFMNM